MPLHEGALYYMKLAQYFVAAPPPNEMDGVHIDLTEEERHGNDRSERTGEDVVGLKAKLLAKAVAGGMERMSESCAGRILPPMTHLGGA